VRKAEPIAGLGGLALLVAAVLDFGVLHAFLAVYALLAIAVPLATLLTKGPAKSIGTAVLASAFGWIAVILALIATDWLAVAASIVAWVGSWLSMRDESTPGAKAPTVPRLPAP
jgi:hypothetical protein